MTLTHTHAEPRMPERIVVLGASGFLGGHFARACTQTGLVVIGLGSRDLDLTDPDAGSRLAQRLQAGDVLVFFAALTPDKGRDYAALMRNIAMCRAVCEASRQAELAHLVCASSDAVYSFDVALISEDTPAVPIDLYGAMHRTRELMLAMEAKAPTAVFRIPGLYGAGDTHN